MERGNYTSQRGVEFPVDNECKVRYHLFFEKEIVNRVMYSACYLDGVLQLRDNDLSNEMSTSVKTAKPEVT